MKNSMLGLLCIALFSLTSCFSISIGTKKEPSRVEMNGLATGYGSLNAIPPYDGTILQAGIFESSARSGEWASFDIWPLGGVGVGFIGARVRLLFLEVGVGVLAYDPKPLKHVTVTECAECKPAERKEDATKPIPTNPSETNKTP